MIITAMRAWCCSYTQKACVVSFALCKVMPFISYWRSGFDVLSRLNARSSRKIYLTTALCDTMQCSSRSKCSLKVYYCRESRSIHYFIVVLSSSYHKPTITYLVFCHSRRITRKPGFRRRDAQALKRYEIGQRVEVMRTPFFVLTNFLCSSFFTLRCASFDWVGIASFRR